MTDYFIGIDVGTGSARAGVFDAEGRLRASAKRNIAIWREEGDIVEQSSNDIWDAVIGSVREAVQQSAIDPNMVKGIGIDATCSLVVLDKDVQPLPVGPSEDPQRNVIVWMDHRAITQAKRINQGGHDVLRYVGGTISPEMQTPKILWLKENRPAIYAAAAHFFDLSDFLAFRATGALERSLCTVTCKWTYLGHERRWDEDYFHAIGLGELAEDSFARIGKDVVDIATPLGAGLSAQAAAELGLMEGTPVGASLIDAHCGGVGTFAGQGPDGEKLDPERQMSLIMGTSACAMTLTRAPSFVDGVWGPYFGVMVPGYWLLEGGQSAYGAALDHLVTLHPAYPEVKAAAQAAGLALPAYLEAETLAQAGSVEDAAFLARDIQVVPEFLGNRAPYADPHATAVLDGLRLETNPASLIRLYVAGLCGLCYGTRQIVEAERGKGIALESLVVSGGAAQSALFRQILADATGLVVALPATDEPVLLGGAIVGAVAGGYFQNVESAAKQMGRVKQTIKPQAGRAFSLHEAKYKAFILLQETNRAVRALIEKEVP